MIERITSLHDYHRVRDAFRWKQRDHFNFATDVVDAWAEADSSRAAMHWIGPGEEQFLTFGQFARRSNQVAAMLTSLGLRRGDRVLVMLPRVIPWWETLLGVFKAGMVALPATTLLTPKDIEYRLQMSGAAAVVTDEAGAIKVDQIRSSLPSLTTRIAIGGDLPNDWRSYEREVGAAAEDFDAIKTRSDDSALIYFTSGTTGQPKMVLHTHASYGIGHQVTGRYWLNLTADDLYWNVSDTGWAKAAWSSFFGPWHCGACLFVENLPGRFDPARVLQLLAEQPITTFCAAPTVYRMLIQQDMSDFRPRALRDCVAAGEPLNPEVISAWHRATGITIRDGYGQTETVLLCGNFPGVPVKPASMGLPAPGFDLAVVDEVGRELPTGQEGDIAVRVRPERPVGLFREYLDNSKATQQSYRGDWYITGDRARVDEDGYFWFVGRADDVITSSAYRIGPFEVESALLEHPAVAEAAVVGKPDPIRGEVVKAIIVLAEGYSGSDSLTAELQEHVKLTTAPYQYPREIEFVAELPKTISGKIRRVELRQRA